MSATDELFIRAVYHSTERIYSVYRRFYLRTDDEHVRSHAIASILLEIARKHGVYIRIDILLNHLHPAQTQHEDYWRNVVSAIRAALVTVSTQRWPEHWFKSIRRRNVEDHNITQRT